MDKLLIVGGSGLLGSHLINQTKDEFDVLATYKEHPFEIEGCKAIYMDITDHDKTSNTIFKENPDIVILCAALRNLDFCEKNSYEAWRVNVEGAKNVAIASKKVCSKLIYISTDMVFDGLKEHYVEEDETSPVNHYGKTKLEGECEVEKSCDDFAIVRVSVLYDWNIFDHNSNFVTWIHDNLMKGKSLRLFIDQYRNATYVKNVCNSLLSICKKNENGIFHVVGKNCVSRLFIGEKVAETFDLDPNLIVPCKSDDMTWLANRPKRCCLLSDKMETRLGIKSMSIEEGLLAMKAEML